MFQLGIELILEVQGSDKVAGFFWMIIQGFPTNKESLVDLDFVGIILQLHL